ncbi:MAG TPA: hypothetical protein VIL72_10715 [Beijerinckiaceae bacterium]
MQDMVRLQARAMRLWFDMVVAQQQAAVTIACRLPILAAEAGGPLTAASETVKMVTEKTAAAQLGAAAAGRVAIRRGRAAGPVAAADAALAMAAAFIAPGGRTVRANARRLSAKRPRKK